MHSPPARSMILALSGALLSVLVAAVGFAERGALAAEPRTLRVGIDPRDPPWAYLPGREDESVDRTKTPSLSPADLRRLVGSDVEIAQALSKRMDARFEIVPTAWVQLEQALLAKRIDLILNSWTPHPALSEQIVASTPYATWSLLVVTRADDRHIRSPADLELARVGHLPDPAVARALAAIGRGKFIEGPRRALFQDLDAGRLDAVIYDSPYIRWLVARQPRYRILGEPLNRLGYHVGVRRADSELLASVNRAIAGLVASGEASRLLRPWGGEAPPP